MSQDYNARTLANLVGVHPDLVKVMMLYSLHVINC
jgi:hypothetical protein